MTNKKAILLNEKYFLWKKDLDGYTFKGQEGKGYWHYSYDCEDVSTEVVLPKFLYDVPLIGFELILEDNEMRLKPMVKLSPYACLFENYDLRKPRATFDLDEIEPIGKEIW